MRILVAGAGVWGSYIADHLVEAGHEVTVVEQDAARARRARAKGGRTVVAGDACEPSVLDHLASTPSTRWSRPLATTRTTWS